eukprot:7967437-Alexandrium_andersonii.AAC.1
MGGTLDPRRHPVGPLLDFLRAQRLPIPGFVAAPARGPAPPAAPAPAAATPYPAAPAHPALLSPEGG